MLTYENIEMVGLCIEENRHATYEIEEDTRLSLGTIERLIRHQKNYHQGMFNID